VARSPVHRSQGTPQLRVTNRSEPSGCIAATFFNPMPNQTNNDHIRETRENRRSTDSLTHHLIRHGIEQRRQGRIIERSSANQEYCGHKLKERV
jgi:hypothetical protein